MAAGSRTVTVRESDVDFGTYALLPGAEPLVEGKAVDLKKMNFIKLPESNPAYADIYTAAHAAAQQARRVDPSLSIAAEAIRITNQMIAERLAQEASRPRAAKVAQSSILDELLGYESPPARSVTDVGPLPEWPTTPKPAELASWLSIPGLGPIAQPPAFAIKFTSQQRDLLLYGQWIYLNQTVGSGQLETVVMVYDKRWKAGQVSGDYLRTCYAFPKGGPSVLAVADIVDNQISVDSLTTFSVNPMIWCMELGDLGLAVFFVDEES